MMTKYPSDFSLLSPRTATLAHTNPLNISEPFLDTEAKTVLTRRRFLTHLGATIAATSVPHKTWIKQATADMGGDSLDSDPLAGESFSGLDMGTQTALAAAEIALRAGQFFAQLAQDHYLSEARNSRADAQHEMDGATLDILEKTLNSLSEIEVHLQELYRAIDATPQRTSIMLNNLLQQQDDLQRSTSLIAIYKHFLQRRQEILSRRDTWNHRATIALYKQDIHKLRFSLQTQRLEAQVLWASPHDLPSRLAMMAAVLMMELEIDAELEALGVRVNSAPSMQSILDWFDAKLIMKEIEMLTDTVSDFENEYEREVQNWNFRYSNSRETVFSPVGGIALLYDGSLVQAKTPARTIHHVKEWLNEKEAIIREQYTDVTCLETISVWGMLGLATNQTWLGTYQVDWWVDSSDTLAQQVERFLKEGYEVEHGCEFDTKKTEQYARISWLRAFRNMASVHLAQRRLVADLIYVARMTANEIIATEQRWSELHGSPAVSQRDKERFRPAEDIVRYGMMLTLCDDGEVIFNSGESYYHESTRTIRHLCGP